MGVRGCWRPFVLICYLIVHPGLQVQPFPNDLHLLLTEGKKKKTAAANLVQPTWHFLSNRRTIVYFLDLEQSYCHFAEGWIHFIVIVCSSSRLQECVCVEVFLNHILNDLSINISTIFLICSLADFWLFHLFPIAHFSIMLCFILVIHCMCRKLQILFRASAKFVSSL